ncbi:hypothetical protein OIU84_001653 [Salix udensis]|uniref:Alpha-N-acetylglucosaminidase N-terminal domain-containing protein n=1 Tax=Salix udensis TaxID=889485 RepID=A0AAD6P6V6_9ROSI|nr:hypothetical protein OIU84_001653 [Salix udensis]
MDSSPLAAVSLVLLASFLFFFSSAQSSTFGVSYISELLEIQDRERALPHVQVAAARGVLQRLLPSHTSSFEFRIVSKEQCGGESCFIIKKSSLVNKARSSTDSVVCSSIRHLNWALFHVFKMMVSWFRDLFLGIITRTLSHLAILLLGGIGKDGKRKLIGWLFKASICH